MIDQLYVFLPMVILAGIISSYTDLKHRQVSNNLIIWGIAYAFILNLFLAIYSLLTSSTQPNSILNYYLNYLLNGIIALVLSFLMWKNRIWKPGDAKLFFVFVLLLPLSVYSNNYIDIFPSVILLINIFVPAALFFGVKLIISSSIKAKREILEKLSKDFLVEVIILIGISWAFSFFSKIISATFGIVQNTTITILSYFFIRGAISTGIKKVRKRFHYLVPLFIILALLIIFLFISSSIKNMPLLLTRLKSILLLLLAYIVFRLFNIASELKSQISKKDLEVPLAVAIFIGVLLTIINKGFFYNIILALFN